MRGFSKIYFRNFFYEILHIIHDNKKVTKFAQFITQQLLIRKKY